ncbi:hypothetical protein MLIT_12450 [Mycolicibacterium litorale]|uniref:Uncharacterized protein n=1 Tax=Mycolicibacterium litorale TaxID=758802 RepID=A0AAD1IJN0_9MYCO|nr:hypothetical protein MLIT_12450 [Mycolicibacterium litorale]
MITPAGARHAFSNITHHGRSLAMFYRKRQRPSRKAAGVDADDNIDQEVKRARSRGTERIRSR